MKNRTRNSVVLIVIAILSSLCLSVHADDYADIASETEQIQYWEKALQDGRPHPIETCKDSLVSYLGWRGKHYLRIGEVQKAAADYRRMVEVFPEKGLFERAQYFEEQKRLPEAEADYLETIKQGFNRDKYGIPRRAKFFEKLGKSEIAYPDWQRAFEIDPRNQLEIHLCRFHKLQKDEKSIRDRMPDIEKRDVVEKVDVDKWCEANNELDEIQREIDSVVIEMQGALAKLESDGLIGKVKAGRSVKQKAGENFFNYLKRDAEAKGRMADNALDEALRGQVSAIQGLLYSTYRVRATNLENLGFKWLKLGLPRKSLQARTSLKNLIPALKAQKIDQVDERLLNVNIGLSYFFAGDLSKAEEYANLSLDRGTQQRNEEFEGARARLLAYIEDARGNYSKALEYAKLADLRTSTDMFSSLNVFQHFAYMAELKAKLGDKIDSDGNFSRAQMLGNSQRGSSKVSADGHLACIEVIRGNYEEALKRLQNVTESYANQNRFDGTRLLLTRALVNAKLKKNSDAERDLTLCKGWLEELPMLNNLANTAANALSDARGAKFPLNSPVREKFALIVGIGDFKDKNIPKLRYATKDANDVRDMLVNDYGFKSDNIRLLKDQQATKGSVLNALRNEWLPKVAQPDDLVLLFISSHGTPAHKDLGARNYVVMHDSDKERLYTTSLPMEQICEFLRTKCKARKTLVIADTCYSGGIVKVLPSSVGGDKEGNLNPEDFVLANQMLVVSSSDVSQKSWESKRYPNGVFTRQLIESFKKHRNYSDFKQVFEDLRISTSKEVKEDENAEQSPRLAGGTWTGVEAGQ